MTGWTRATSGYTLLMIGKFQARAAALLEVLGIYLTGPVAIIGLRRLLGLSLANPLSHLTAHATGAQLVTASRQLFTLLVVQNAGYYLLAAPLDWWHRRRGRRDYGLTKAGHSWKMLILAGLGAAAMCEWLAVSITLANSVHPGPTVAWRQAFFDMSWQRWQFWLFAGVLSWAGAPFFEEIFYRGYCQRRLAEDWGDGPAIVGAACLFTFAHAQYQRLDAYNVGMITGLLLSAVGFGVVFAWTRSLIPAMIAHAIFDVPMTTVWQGLLLAALAIGAALVWQRASQVAKQVFSTGGVLACVALGIVGTAYAILASRDQVVVYVVPAAIGMFVLAIILEARERRQARAPKNIAEMAR